MYPNDTRSVPRLPSRSTRALLRACAIGLLATCGVAHAHYFCITTAAELQDALTQSSDGGLYDDEDNSLFLVHGLYKTGTVTGNQPFFYYAPTSTHEFDLLGGYADGCSAPTRQTPATRLDGNGQTGVLVLRSTHGAVFVRGLTLQNGNGNQPGAGLQINYLVTVNNSVDVYDVIVRNNHSSVDGGGMYVAGSGSGTRLFDNLIIGNSTDGNYGGALIVGSGDTNGINNNTVARNTAAAASGAVGGLFCGGSTPCQIEGSIFWNNTGVGLYLDDGLGVLHYNDIGTLGGQAPGTSEGNVSVNPQFVDADNGDFHLAGNSTLLGTCPYISHSSDLDNNPPTLSGRIDLGAYEETIFIDGVDGN
ncbi:MAG: NosD domain-containing protein [Dokdonella sp.]